MSQARTVGSLALLYAFRMLGLFMVLPILMLYGGNYLGSSPFLLGLALGIYGLTQACFQVPLGLLSDIVGRKPVIIGGLILFALGSFIASFAKSIEWLIIGRALQGSGAIASTIMAMVADLTSEENRTKAMAAIGASIGLSFSIAMVLGPAVAGGFGLNGVFYLAAILSLLGIFIVIFMVPSPKVANAHRDIAITPALVKKIIRDTQLLRLNWGIFCLHCILMTCFVCVPSLLEETLSISKADHWQFYLPVLFIAFVVMLPFMIVAEKKRKIKLVFISAVATLALSCAALAYGYSYMLVLISGIFIFFVAFNLLESMLPSLVSKIAPAGAKGTAMGLYSTSQFLGAFFGGVVGGWLLEFYSIVAVFGFSMVLAFTWLTVAFSMISPRHLARMCVSARDPSVVDKALKIEGVAEAYHVVEESLLYLKVDRDNLDELALQNITGSTQH